MNTSIHRPSIKASTLAFIVIGLLFLSSVFTIVGPGERGVVVTHGEVTGQVFDEGFHFKMPIVTKVVKMDVKFQMLNLLQAPATSKDGESITVDIHAKYSLESDKVSTIYKAQQNNYESELIKPAFQDAISQSIAQYQASKLLVDRVQISNLIAENLGKSLKQFHINVQEIFLENIEFSESYSSALEKKL